MKIKMHKIINENLSSSIQKVQQEKAFWNANQNLLPLTQNFIDLHHQALTKKLKMKLF